MTSPAPEPSIHLYAELLLNIKSITLYGSIISPTSAATTADLRVRGSVLTVTHLDSSATVSLPAKPIGSASATLHLPEGEAKELSSRFSIDGGNVLDLLTLQEESGGSECVPWGAAQFVAVTGIEVKCAQCETPLVPKGRLSVWKDLPRDGWAEMMDFWHCHKPDPEPTAQAQQDGNDTANKGYAAGNRIETKPFTALVDVVSFLLSPLDCINIKATEQDETQSQASDTTPSRPVQQTETRTQVSLPRPLPLHCSGCDAYVGATDPGSSGYRILKSSITISYPSATDPEEMIKTEFAVEPWAAAMLLSTVESTGGRRFLVKDDRECPGDGREHQVELWVFTPDLYVCSSMLEHHAGDRVAETDPYYDNGYETELEHFPEEKESGGDSMPSSVMRAVKVLYRTLTSTASTPTPPPTNGEPVVNVQVDVAHGGPEELEMPPTLRSALLNALEENSRLLPQAARRYRDWDVSVLQRFRTGDVRLPD